MVQNGNHKCGRKSEVVMDEKTISEDDVVYSKVYLGSRYHNIVRFILLNVF